MSAQARFFGQTLPPPIKKEIKHGALNKQIKHHKKQQDEDKKNNKKIAEDDKYVYYEYHDDEEEDEAIDDGLEEKALVAAAAAAARRRSSTNVATVKPASTAAAAPKDANEAAIEAKNKFLNKMQPLVPIENEGDIDLGHNYDGIRELDNPPPPWWKLAFAATIIFAPIYLYRYHIAHSAPLQLEELAIAIEEGEARKAEYLANSPNAIDENNIATMEGIEASAGATIFAKNCVACHGAAGEGNAVGPNLTDVNWIHGGGLTNIFKSVKYGWPEKGMKSWQADLSSLEIAQVSTYVHSIQGSNPPNAKEPQGDVWAEGGAAPAEAAAEPSADSTATAE